MALFYFDNNVKKTAKTTTLHHVRIQDLDYQGLGVAKLNGKTWFIENALPTEDVDARVQEEKRQYGRAQAVRFHRQSANRQIPSCAIYGQCGGCQMQHIPLTLQRETKQKALFQRLQKLQPAPIAFQPMIVGNDKGYRRRAKLSMALQKNKFVIGFRQADSQEIISLTQCDVLEPALSDLLPKLQNCLSAWKQKKNLGHLELVRADNGIALLLRHIGPVHPQDRDLLLNFAQTEQLMLFVMTDKQQIEQWLGEQPYYRLHGLTLHFSIRDFIQVNDELNQRMVDTAITWLEPDKQDRILDLFCGMGNFTLPLAPLVQRIVGIEGVEPMVEQARRNAELNAISNAEFYRANLDESFADQPWTTEHFNKVLLDPARNGAHFALDHLCRLSPDKILYVSCNPATLVRDAEKLIQAGYCLEKCAMIDMFPHTGHLESISLFTK